MLTINAKLEGHRLTITGTPQLAADSARVDRVKFDFDDEWTGFSRVALFWGSDGEEPYAVAVDGQGYAVIPWETIQEKGRMRFGVYGIKGTSRITSTVLKYQIQDGAWSASPANPGEITPTMLEQLQALVETAVEQMDDRLAEFDAAVETFFPHRGGVGALVTVEGTVDASPAGLTIYGRSVQEGATPAPDAPADIVTAGSGGTLAMVSTGADMDDDPDRLTSAIPTELYGLPGIPVASGGNYTDTDGQMWICDTIDLEAGTWTKRVETYTVTGSESISKSSESAVDTYLLYFPTGTPDLVKGNTAFLCSHFRASGATAVGNAEIPTTGNYLRMRCHYASAGTSTVEAFTAAITGMTVVYALAAPVVTQLTEAQIAALRAFRGRKGLTNLYSADPAGPEFRAEMYIDIPTYIAGLMG